MQCMHGGLPSLACVTLVILQDHRWVTQPRRTNNMCSYFLLSKGSLLAMVQDAIPSRGETTVFPTSMVSRSPGLEISPSYSQGKYVQETEDKATVPDLVG